MFRSRMTIIRHKIDSLQETEVKKKMKYTLILILSMNQNSHNTGKQQSSIQFHEKNELPQ